MWVYVDNEVTNVVQDLYKLLWTAANSDIGDDCVVTCSCFITFALAHHTDILSLILHDIK